MPPDEFWAKPEKVKRFMLASMMYQLEVDQKKHKDWLNWLVKTGGGAGGKKEHRYRS